MEEVVLVTRRPWLRGRSAVTVLAVVAVAVVAAAALAFASQSSADRDEKEIKSLIRAYEATEAEMSQLPQSAVRQVEERLAALPAVSSRTGRGQDVSPVAILPEAVRQEIDRRVEACDAEFCSSSWRARHVNDVPMSDVIESGLYNNAEPDSLLDGRYITEVLSVNVMRNDGQAALAWAYSWTGPDSAGVPGGQSWVIQEYRLVREDDAWKLDARTPLVTAAAETDDEGAPLSWGPDAPHDSLADAEQESASALYSDQVIPKERLQALVDAAEERLQP